MTPNMPANRAIELHDSRLLAVRVVDADVVLTIEFCIHASEGIPARDDGSGWSQNGEVVILGGTIDIRPDALPLWIMDGSVEVDDTRFGNILPLPFEHTGRVVLRLDGDEGSLVARGSGVQVRLLGAPEFVEMFRGA